MRVLGVLGCAAIALILAAESSGCAAVSTVPPRSSLERVRSQAPSSDDPEVVGDWLLAEMISPGGEAKRATDARVRLERLGGKGLRASIARALDDDVHGHPSKAAVEWVDVLRAARESGDSVAPLAAWYAAERVVALRDSAGGLWKNARGFVEAALEAPGNLGWRARADLVELWSAESYDQASHGVPERAAQYHGCQKAVRLAGPFGRGSEADLERSFEPERPGSWARYFTPDPHRPKIIPHIHKTERQPCEIRSAEPSVTGVHYAETFFDLARSMDVTIAVQGARKLLVDDVPVLKRSPRSWGTWPHFGVQVRLAPGRHRIVAKLDSAVTSVRLLRSDGSPLPVVASDDPSPSYSTQPPVVARDPNVLDAYLRDGDVVRPHDDLTAFLAGYLAQVESQNDVGSVLLEPLIADAGKAGAVALALQAQLVQLDPIYPPSDAHDAAKDLYTRVLAKDPEVWRARAWLAEDGGDKKGLPAVAKELRALYDHFSEVPEIAVTLTEAYDRLGWQAEQSGLVQEAAKRFPRHTRVLRALVDVLENQGRVAEADEVASKLLTQDPDSVIRLDRAIRRKDYKAAITELKRLAARRPERKDLARELEALASRAGLTRESFDQLEKALAKNPQDAAARLALADARLARGDHYALRKALADAVQNGAPSADLANAIELLEGTTELEPYRLNSRRVIDEFVKAGGEMEGNAVRVLDYSVLWLHPDGSSRMLEHEIVRVQSQESIQKMAEQPVPEGLVLRVRVIKKDGRILEPEFLASKPTLTMPHLEVGDYIETESIKSTPGDGIGGMTYEGPHWFFREKEIGYWRSEFVVVSPKDRPLTVEKHGSIPEPTVTEEGMLVTRRWRVDRSPAAVVEPGAVPIQELLPSVRVGWGLSLDRTLRVMVDTLADQGVRDPRLRRMADRIVQGVPPSAREERARRVYRWVLSNTEKGQERDGRRIVIGKSGEPLLGFIYLTRLLGIPTEIVAVRDRLTEPPVGPIAQSELFNDFVVRLQTERGELFLTVGDKFAPFGYLPAELRGQPGYRLVEGTPRVTTGTAGSFDGIVYEGKAKMREDGTAEVDLQERFVGKYGIAVRRSLESIPNAQLHDVVESKLLAVDLPGASLLGLEIQDQDDLDKPLTLHITAIVPDFARRQSGGLVLSPPFRMRVGRMASLAERKTPMIIPDASRMEVRLRVKLPPKSTLAGAPTTGEFRNEDRQVLVQDRVEGDELVLSRVLDIPAARIPVDKYSAFQDFARAADEATQREVRISIQR